MLDTAILETGDHSSDKDRVVWVIGGKNANADKSFLWTDDIQDITDADIIIIDLSTFPNDSLEHKKARFAWPEPGGAPPPSINQYIEKWRTRIINNLVPKLTSGGHVIFLLDTNQVSDYMIRNGLIPFEIDIAKREKRNIVYNNNTFTDYLRYVKHADYVIRIPTSILGLDATSEIRLLHEHGVVTDKSERRFGTSFDVDGRRGGLLGRITLLPSITIGTHEQAIDAIVAVFKTNTADSAPSWIESVPIPGIEEITQKIESYIIKKNEIELEMSNLESEKSNLCKWHRLLYSYGKPLEVIVRDAFVLMGLTETGQGRSSEKEDLLTEIRSTSEIGVIEVKGHRTKAHMTDIDQCIRWTEEYKSENPSHKAKGILVLNQLRLEPLPESIRKRSNLERNQIQLAELREICVIPTYVLFEAIKKILEGHSPDRAMIERKISGTNGVLKSMFD